MPFDHMQIRHYCNHPLQLGHVHELRDYRHFYYHFRLAQHQIDAQEPFPRIENGLDAVLFDNLPYCFKMPLVMNLKFKSQPLTLSKPVHYNHSIAA